MITLSTRTVVRDAAAVSSGCHGAVTARAQEARCSREALYRHAREIRRRLEPTPSAAPTPAVSIPPPAMAIRRPHPTTPGRRRLRHGHQYPPDRGPDPGPRPRRRPRPLDHRPPDRRGGQQGPSGAQAARRRLRHRGPGAGHRRSFFGADHPRRHRAVEHDRGLLPRLARSLGGERAPATGPLRAPGVRPLRCRRWDRRRARSPGPAAGRAGPGHAALAGPGPVPYRPRGPGRARAGLAGGRGRPVRGRSGRRRGGGVQATGPRRARRGEGRRGRLAAGDPVVAGCRSPGSGVASGEGRLGAVRRRGAAQPPRPSRGRDRRGVVGAGRPSGRQSGTPSAIPGARRSRTGCGGGWRRPSRAGNAERRRPGDGGAIIGGRPGRSPPGRSW